MSRRRGRRRRAIRLAFHPRIGRFARDVRAARLAGGLQDLRAKVRPVRRAVGFPAQLDGEALEVEPPDFDVAPQQERQQPDVRVRACDAREGRRAEAGGLREPDRADFDGETREELHPEVPVDRELAPGRLPGDLRDPATIGVRIEGEIEPDTRAKERDEQDPERERERFDESFQSMRSSSGSLRSRRRLGRT